MKHTLLTLSALSLIGAVIGLSLHDANIYGVCGLAFVVFSIWASL